ncbi:MAG: M48 family metalloprotease [Verrucomicrobiales bacterium]
MAGTTITCPECGIDTLLTLPERALEEDLEPTAQITQEMLNQAMHGKARKQGTSIVYHIGLLAVTIAIVLLPLLYLGMVAAAAYGVFLWAKGGLFLLTLRGGGFYGMILKAILYLAPIVGGSVAVFFMVKPLLARAAPHAQPLALNPGSEKLIFAFITQICRAVGAPFPSRVDVDCETNASASFRRGWKSMFGNDLVLTLGLPLVSGLTATQLAGVIAHEFGHFTQSMAMRLSYIIRRVNLWFVRVIYHRDVWDLRLDTWAEDAEDWKEQMVIGAAHFGVWCSRSLLKVLMYIGALLSSFVSRQMEYDADKHMMEVIGSKGLEDGIIRLATLGVATNLAGKSLDQIWTTTKALPNDIPLLTSLLDAKIPEETRGAIADRVGLERSGFLSTHPSDGDRIRCARQANRPGIFSLDVPARELFANFNVLSEQVTYLHYEDTLGIPRPAINLRPTQSFFHPAGSSSDKDEPIANPAKEELERRLGPAKLKLKTLA